MTMCNSTNLLATDSMKQIEALKELFNQAQSDYSILKNQIENQVVRWFWASNDIFSLNPFWFEENRFSKGKVLKEEPKNKEHAVQYGVNATDEIIVVRAMTDLKDDFYETFYFRGENEILSYHFDYGKDKELINVKKYLYENDRIKAVYSCFEENGYWVEDFIYKNNKLICKEWQGVDNYGEYFKRVVSYEYDDIGQLKIIREGSYIKYQKPDKKLSYKKLKELTAEKLLSLLKEAIKNHAPKEKLYCINLSYFSENMIPPMIGFGAESDRKNWLDNDYNKSIIWNVADYSHQVELECDDETATLFDLFNQETELANKYSTAIKIIQECAKDIKQDLQNFDLDITDDFVIVAGYFDQSDLKKI